MRRSILLALVAALALALVANMTTAAADAGGAQAAAKKKAGKCAKPKGKKKAGKSLADSAAKKKGKKKAACKPKAKKKGQAKPEPKGGLSLADGTYMDSGQGVTVTVTGNGRQASIRVPGTTCSGRFPFPVDGALTQEGSVVKGSGTASLFGGNGTAQWTLKVTLPSLSYQLDVALNVQFPEQDPCQDTANHSGTLVKQ